MTSPVLQLQQQALDPSVAVSDLLRRALVVATKLDLSDFKRWINDELTGYHPRDTPDYRCVRGRLQVRYHPTAAWEPFSANDPETDQRHSIAKFYQGIGEIENFVNGSSRSFHYFISQRNEYELACHLSRSALAQVLVDVRTMILNWALQLERDGILGEGFAFTTEEKASAAIPTYNNVNNFYGSVGNTQIAQASPHASQTVRSGLDGATLVELSRALRESRDGLELDDDDSREFDAELATLEAQAESPRPKHAVIRESLLSLKRILESAAGSSAGQLAFQIGVFLAS